MSQIKAGAKAIKNGTDNERHYDRDLIDILSEEVVGVFNPLIADDDLRRLVLADAYAKECVRNHRNGIPSDDLDESLDIVGEMIIDGLYGSDPEYMENFDGGEDDEDDVDCIDEEEDPDDSFRSCVDRYIAHLKECCIYDESLLCIGCGLCDYDPIFRLFIEDIDDDSEDIDDDLGFYDDDDSDHGLDNRPDDSEIPCSGHCGGACHGCCNGNPSEEDTIPRFEVIKGRLTITFVGRGEDA